MITHLVLGVVQGLAEFLPISSSGHLVLAERLLGVASPGLLYEAFLHLGTLGAVLVVFRRDLAGLLRSLTPRGSLEQRKEIGLMIIGTVPIVVVGLALRGAADDWFHSLWVVGIGWLATAVVLITADRWARRTRMAIPSAAGAFGIGMAQAAALVPGISRSGVSIGVGMIAGLQPGRAARFSFLLSIPAVAGAAGLTLWDGLREPAAPNAGLLGILVGTGAAFVVGLIALRSLLTLVARGRLWPFAVYCGVLSVVTLVLAALG